MKAVCLVDGALATAFGPGLEPLWEGLMAGRSAIAPVTRFPVENYTTRLAACADLGPAGPAGSLLPHLLEQVLAGLGPVPADARLFTASTKVGIDALEHLRRGDAADPVQLLPESLQGTIANRYGLQDRGLNINAACASSTLALARGAALIASGAAEAVLVVCLDLVSEFVFSGFSALQALSPSGARPFDRQRNGLNLGEGGAALLLMEAGRARREGRAPLATLLGWGAANDAHHVTAPARDGCGLVQATRQALQRAALPAAAIAAVSAHGTATIYNDAMELTAFRTVFGERLLPVHSAKGAIGHTLGAAGGIEVLLGARILAEQTVPPTVGCSEPEDAAIGQVSAAAQPCAGDYLLSTNSGFGGINVALVLGRGTT